MNKQQETIPFLSVGPNGCILIDGKPSSKDILQLNIDSAEVLILPSTINIDDTSEISGEHYAIVDEDAEDVMSVGEDVKSERVPISPAHDHDYRESNAREYYVYTSRDDISTDDVSRAVTFGSAELETMNDGSFIRPGSSGATDFIGMFGVSGEYYDGRIPQSAVIRIKTEQDDSEYFEYGTDVSHFLFERTVKQVSDDSGTPKRNSKPTPFTCQICEKSFSQQSNLWKHIRTHTGERPYHCPTCGKRFSQRANMIKHQVVHTGQRPYACKVCDRGFTQRANLSKHMRLHTGEKPFLCDFCSKRFTQRSNLVKHRYLHLGIRPYSCPSCFQTFTQQSNLKKHVLIHTDVKKHFCEFCNKGYVQKISAQKHMERCKTVDASARSS